MSEKQQQSPLAGTASDLAGADAAVELKQAPALRFTWAHTPSAYARRDASGTKAAWAAAVQISPDLDSAEGTLANLDGGEPTR